MNDETSWFEQEVAKRLRPSPEFAAALNAINELYKFERELAEKKFELAKLAFEYESSQARAKYLNGRADLFTRPPRD